MTLPLNYPNRVTSKLSLPFSTSNSSTLSNSESFLISFTYKVSIGLYQVTCSYDSTYYSLCITQTGCEQINCEHIFHRHRVLICLSTPRLSLIIPAINCFEARFKFYLFHESFQLPQLYFFEPLGSLLFLH